MSYGMTHLAVAKELAERLNITDHPQYYMGAIAPDSVHMRENYHSDMKKNSHYIANSIPWGTFSRLEEVDEWYENCAPNMQGLREHSSFYTGCIVHVLTDIFNTREFAVPFAQWCENKTKEETSGLYVNEFNKIDKQINNTASWKNEVFQHLQKAKGETVSGIIFAEETEKYRDWLIENYRSNKNAEPLSPSKASPITYEKNLRFIKNASEKIMELFHKCTGVLIG
jgi:hypothetical protein